MPMTELERVMRHSVRAEFNKRHGSTVAVRAFGPEDAPEEALGVGIVAVDGDTKLALYGALPTDWLPHALGELETKLLRAAEYSTLLLQVHPAHLAWSTWKDTDLAEMARWMLVEFHGYGRTTTCKLLVETAAKINRGGA